MMRNNKGYMLIEIILASAIAFGLSFFIIDLTIRLKNKNDDLLVDSQISTDQAIIVNKLMPFMKNEEKAFDCNKLIMNNNVLKYNGNFIDTLNKYASSDKISCENNMGTIKIRIPLTIKQMTYKNYDISIEYKYQIGDMIPPTCSLTIANNKVVFSTKEDNYEIEEFGISDSEEEKYGISELTIKEGSFYGYVKDQTGNVGSCLLDIIKMNYGQVDIRRIGYCTYNCVVSGVSKTIQIGPVRGCDNPCPGPGGIISSYVVEEPINGYYCNSGYTKINDNYCYK